MFKFLLLTFTLTSASYSWANDFLRSDKQVLFCAGQRAQVRFDWQDFENQKKKIEVKYPYKIVTLKPVIDREFSAPIYFIEFTEKGIDEKGRFLASTSGHIEIEEILKDQPWGGYTDTDYYYKYIDKSLSDKQVKKICKEIDKKMRGN